MSYPDSVRYLYALGNELKAGAKFGLERIQALLAALKNPERGQAFIHVAGTNGKGSTCAMIASALRAAGFTTGLYTSPHLVEPTERIQLNGVPLTEKEFADAFQTVHDAAEALLREGEIDAHPSYFETVTAMAFLVFRKRAQIGVVEVGLGGRLDATNVLQPELTVITPIDYDHEAYLGSSLTSIAAEKAGILKAGVPVILARQHAAADEVIAKRAGQLGCEVTRTSDADIDFVNAGAQGSSFSYEGETFRCPLPGRHQIENALTAVMACRKLGIDDQAIAAGLEETRWPGRLEYISREPDFVLDGAHNPGGAAALSAYIREFCTDRPVWMVYGAMRDKAIQEVTELLFPLVDRLIVTAAQMPRALRPEAILEMTEHPNTVIVESVGEAIEIARKAPREAIVFFTGSLFIVGEARGLLAGQGGSRDMRMA